MKLTPCKVRGQDYWKLELGTGPTRKRHFFKTEQEGLAALKRAQKDRADLGKSWEVLTASEKVELMALRRSVLDLGMSLPEAVKRLSGGILTPKATRSLKDAVDELILAKRSAKRRPLTIRNLKTVLGHFIEGRGEVPVHAVTHTDIVDWFTARQETPQSESHFLRQLSIFFNYCLARRYITENPLDGYSHPSIERKIPAILTTKQCQAILTWCRENRPDSLAWLVLTLFVGLRPMSEALNVTWRDIDLVNGRLMLERTKTLAPRIPEFSFVPPALPWLKLAKKLKSKLPMSDWRRQTLIAGMRERLKLTRWPQDVLRHTAASNLLAFHQDAGKVANFLGNSPGVLLRDYKALVVREDAEAFMGLMP